MTLTRELLILLVARVLQLLLALITVRASTMLLTVEQYGMLALLMGFNALCGLFLVNPIGTHIQRHTHQWAVEGSLLAMLRQFNGYVVGIAGVAVILVASWAFARGEGTVHHRWLAAIAVGWLVYAFTWNGTLVSMLNMVGFRGVSASAAVMTTLFALAGSVILSSRVSSALYWIAGQALGLTIIAVPAMYALRSRVRPGTHAHTPADLKLLTSDTIWSFCFPLAMATGFMWVLTSGYRFVVEWGWGARSLGFMVAGLAVATQVWTACETLVIQFLFPHFYKAISDDDPVAQQRAYSNLINTVCPLYMLLLGVTVASGGWIMAVLTDTKFHDAYVFALFGAGIEWCRATASLLSQAAQVTKRTAYVIGPYALSGSLAIGGGFVAGWAHASLYTVAVVLMAAGLLLVVTMGRQMDRLIHADIEWRSVFGMSAVASVIVLIAALVGLHPRPFKESLLALTGVGLAISAPFLIFIRSSRPYRALLSVPLRPGHGAMDLHGDGELVSPRKV